MVKTSLFRIIPKQVPIPILTNKIGSISSSHGRIQILYAAKGHVLTLKGQSHEIFLLGFSPKQLLLVPLEMS